MSTLQRAMTIQTLCQDLVTIPADYDFSVTGLTLDSRKVVPGDLFFACIGEQYDARDFIDEASNRGAVAIFCEALSDSDIREIDKYQKHYTVPVVPVLYLSEKIGWLASRFYGVPSEHMDVIGVTGTNGKTSCCHFIAHALGAVKDLCAIIGTAGNGFPDELQQSQLTTPDKVGLHRLMADYYRGGAKALAFEASSHGLVQNRLAGVAVDIGVFTNLTREHLDYHLDMHHYAQAKRLLFQIPTLKTAVINLEDEFGQQLIRDFASKLTIYGFTTEGSSVEKPKIPTVIAHDVDISADGIRAFIVSPWGQGELKSSLLGRFNLSNLLAVLTCLGIMRVPFASALACVSQLPGIVGRMEPFGGQDQPLVVVDYAHTTDALEQVLKVLKNLVRGELWCVFGCGGERDTGKRPIMGKAAEQYCHHVVITNDNPRHDEPRDIAEAILQGMDNSQKAIVQLDRRKAIIYAISEAKANDIVLIAGKGHETYQQIGDVKYPFSDQQVVQDILNKNRADNHAQL